MSDFYYRVSSSIPLLPHTHTQTAVGIIFPPPPVFVSGPCHRLPVPFVPPLTKPRPGSLCAGGDTTALMTGCQSSASASPSRLTCNTLASLYTGHSTQLCAVCMCIVRIMLLTLLELDGFTGGGHYADVSASSFEHTCHATDMPLSRWHAQHSLVESWYV